MKKKYLNIALFYTIAAIACGIFFREFTKLNNFTGVTVLSKTHTHLFILGMIVFIIISIASSRIGLENEKKFRLFMILYNIGLPLTVTMMIIRGICQVLNMSLSSSVNSMISGIAGAGHILLGLGLIILILAMKDAAKD